MAPEEHVKAIGPLIKGSLITVGPDHTLIEAARKMVANKVGAAVVLGGSDGHPGIITERDLMRAVADARDLSATSVSDYMTPDAISASPSWAVGEAARRMLRGGFRHLVVLDETGDAIGMLSIRDLVSALLDEESSA